MARPLDKQYIPALGADMKWYPDGPGTGFSYNSGTLFPGWRFQSEEEVESLCIYLNLEYLRGYQEKQEELSLLITGNELDNLESIVRQTSLDYRKNSTFEEMLKTAHRMGVERFIYRVRKLLEIERN